MTRHNPNCDGSHCDASTGEVRLLPLGGGGNVILCRNCFAHEIAWRKDRNRALAVDCRFALPEWEACEVYETEVRP